MNSYGTSVRLRNTSRWSSAFRRRHCADGSRRSLARLTKTQAEACATKELTSGTPMRHENSLQLAPYPASPRLSADSRGLVECSLSRASPVSDKAGLRHPGKRSWPRELERPTEEPAAEPNRELSCDDADSTLRAWLACPFAAPSATMKPYIAGDAGEEIW